MMNVEVTGIAEAIAQLRQAPSKIQRNVIRAVSRRVVRNIKKRTEAQVDVNSQPFKLHYRHPGRPLLVLLSKRIRTLQVKDDEALVGFRNGRDRYRASINQLGNTTTINRASLAKNSALSMTSLATRSQALALIKNGFKSRRRNGPGTATPTVEWITTNMTVGEAGAALRFLRGKPKNEWTTTIPPRPFIGIADSELAELTALAYQSAMKALANQQEQALDT